jgi:TRAP-type C4-dicarboxylate transport system permease small subunit
MNPSIYAIVSTFVSFAILLIYYAMVKPDFVKEVDKNSTDQTPKFSVRLSIVYGLLFSSMIGLLVLGVSSILKNYKNSDNEMLKRKTELSSNLSELSE